MADLSINHNSQPEDSIKKHDFKSQNEIHSTIRNDEDYDDWEYGTEPTFGSKS